MCWLHRETEEHQSGHQPRDSRRERAGGWGGSGEQGGLPVQVQSEEGRPQRLLWGWGRPQRLLWGQRNLFPCLGVQREAEVLQGVEEAQEDGKCGGTLGGPWTAAATGGIMDSSGKPSTAHLKGGGFVSCQATELSDAILEGYPKSKKQFFVSDVLPSLLPWGLRPGRSHSLVLLPLHRRKKLG